MAFKKFEENEIFYNTIKTTPHFEFKIYGENGYLNDSNKNVKLNDLNLGSKYYPFISKSGQLSNFKTVSTASFTSAQYGDAISGSYPYTSSIDIRYYPLNSTNRAYLNALKNNLNRYSINSRDFLYSSSLGDKNKQALTLISVPSVLFGSSIEKGSVSLECQISGTIVARVEDINKNGELIQTYSYNSTNLGKTAGVVMYNEGFIILTGSWSVYSPEQLYVNLYDSTFTGDDHRWIYWGAGLSKNNSYATPLSSSFSLSFNGTNYIQTVTMLANAEKGELNHSNNPTYLKFGEAEKYSSDATKNCYVEPENLEIKNTVKYKYNNFTGSLEKQTFISKIHIYDEDKNLLGIAKVSKPIKKTENRDLTFKLKLDI